MKKHYNSFISIEDLSYLAKLSETGLALNQCLSLLKTKRNREIFSKIKERLDQGEPIEKAIEDYLPGKIRSYLVPLLHSLPFASALSLSLHFYELSKEGKKMLLSQVAYPLILLFVSVTALYLFDLYGIDAIFSLIFSFEENIGIYRKFRQLFRIVARTFYYGILFLFLLVSVFSKKDRIILLYIFISKHLPNSFVNIYYSKEFMALFLACINRGYSTRESLQILKTMKQKPVISFLAYHMDESLMEGETLKEAAGKSYYDSSLSRFIKIANYTNDFSALIDSYILLSSQKIAVRMKRYTLGIQLFTYAFIGAVIIFIYQILFMPMRIISAF